MRSRRLRVQHPHSSADIRRKLARLLPATPQFLHAKIGIGIVRRPPYEHYMAVVDCRAQTRREVGQRVDVFAVNKDFAAGCVECCSRLVNGDGTATTIADKDAR